MPKLKNRFNVPSIPVFYQHPETKHRIEWRTATETFANWVGKVWAYCDGNGKERPTEDFLDEVACQQMPRAFCTQEKNYHAPHMVARSTGCSACGGRK